MTTSEAVCPSWHMHIFCLRDLFFPVNDGVDLDSMRVWLTYCMWLGPEVSVMTLSLVTCLSSPAACCIYVHIQYMKWHAVEKLHKVLWDIACMLWKQAELYIYTVYIYIFFSVFPFLFCSDYPDMWKGLWGKRSFSNTNTSTYTLLGRCRSMSKQDYDLCMSHQSDSLKGHVGSVHTRQRVTFNWAAADREGRPLTSHAPSFVNQLHTHIHTLIPCPLFTRHYFSSLPLYLPHLYLFFCCFLVPNSSLRW